LAREFFVFESFSLEHLHERIAEQKLVLSIVETEGHLLQVGGEMLDGDFMPRSYNAALEETEGRLDCIRADRQPAFVTDVFFFAVVHSLVLAAILGEVEIVELGFVRHDDIHGRIDVARDNLVDLLLIQILGMNEVQAPAALSDADDRRVLLPLVFVLCVTTDVHLINFDRARQLVLCFFHCLADAMAQIPRGLVGDSEHSLDLIRAHSLARFRKQVDNEKPLSQRQMRVMEDGSNRHRKLVAAGIANVHFAVGDRLRGHVIAVALQAAHAIGKAEMF